jgi:hypothetical protein
MTALAKNVWRHLLGRDDPQTVQMRADVDNLQQRMSILERLVNDLTTPGDV